MTCSPGGSALKIDPSKMARSFSRKLSNTPTAHWSRKNGSKTLTGELLDTLPAGKRILMYFLAKSTQHDSPADLQGIVFGHRVFVTTLRTFATEKQLHLLL